jgi:DNA-binding MarR family transcriptional regulator
MAIPDPSADLDAEATMTGTSIYTPSTLSAEALEELFVAREPILEQIAIRIAEASKGPSRNHTLLVGPRGAGKTHLIAMAYNRAAACLGSTAKTSDGKGKSTARLSAGRRSFQLSWLPEDPWGIASYRHLLLAILGGLQSGGDLAANRMLSEEDLENQLSSTASTDGPIVIFLENLDQILEAITNKGQQRLRHLAQSGALLFVASTTRLSRALASVDGPLYGFFTETELAPLTVDEAKEMLTKIAQRRGDSATVAALSTPQGLSRVRTVEHLAGGQPRIWSILADSLSIDGAISTTDALLATFDHLTPYYQEQLGRLSPNQRLIISALIDEDRALTVKDIASVTGIDQRSVSGTLTELRDRRWVQPVDSFFTRKLSDKRLVYYDLAEPLARVVFQMKSTKDGEPIRLLLDFVSVWFDEDALDWLNLEPETRKVLELAFGSELGGLSRILGGHFDASELPPEFVFSVAKATVAGFQGMSESAMQLSTGIRSSVEAALEERGLPGTLSNMFACIYYSISHQEDSEFRSEIGSFFAPKLEQKFLRSVALCWCGEEETAARLRPHSAEGFSESFLVSESRSFGIMVTDLLFFMSCWSPSTQPSGKYSEYSKRLRRAAKSDNKRRKRLTGESYPSSVASRPSGSIPDFQNKFEAVI